ncbi:MAG: spore germination protein, partial [Clostridia bacterium]|nr:spore germination protein [Clostridia bacterium]
IIDAKGWDSRNISEPTNEVTVRGPREGFTETLRVNTSLLRRKIRDPNLTFETVKLGERTQTHVSIVYLNDLTNPKIVETLKERLKTIQIDGILDSGYIDEFIEDAPYSIFSTISRSERPDTVASKILEGRVAILVDGTPIALTVPMLFIESFQSPEDYYSRSYYSSMVRMIRFVSFFISILAPGIYIAITTFHQEMIPTPLLITMVESRAGVPFPAFLECLVMVLSFEILKEAGIRLPRSVGQAVSIVGALVIGESAVSAGLIGEPMVIVIAVTAIASFVIPDLSDISGILRLIFIGLAGLAGAYGIILGLLGMTIHLINLESFGAPFLSPLIPLDLQGMKDAFDRFPLWTFNRRPKALKAQDTMRQKFWKGTKQNFQNKQ